MANTQQSKLGDRLRTRFTQFLSVPGNRTAILLALSEWRQYRWTPFLFGGFLRDLMVLGSENDPRDIDVVLGSGNSDQIENSLGLYIKRRTRFGGFQIEVQHWRFDVWPLERTWAFTRNASLTPTPENLPRTTFLNVEAIATSLDEACNIAEIYECGFFEAIHRKCLDINYLENPYPALAAIRSLITASRLRFSLSQRLAEYILHVSHSEGIQEMISAQRQHYGNILLDGRTIKNIIGELERQTEPGHPTEVYWDAIAPHFAAKSKNLKWY